MVWTFGPIYFSQGRSSDTNSARRHKYAILLINTDSLMYSLVTENCINCCSSYDTYFFVVYVCTINSRLNPFYTWDLPSRQIL